MKAQYQSKRSLTPVASAQDLARYQSKYQALKVKVASIEQDNTETYLKILKTKRNIQRLRLERTILYDRLYTARQLQMASLARTSSVPQPQQHPAQRTTGLPPPPPPAPMAHPHPHPQAMHPNGHQQASPAPSFPGGRDLMAGGAQEHAAVYNGNGHPPVPGT